MNAVTAMHHQHAVETQRLALARDKAASRLAEHVKTSALKANELAGYEAIFIAKATSDALGVESTQELPDANIIEKLRADIAVSEPVRRELTNNLSKCENALKLSEVAHKYAISDHLKDAIVRPALNELHRAFDSVREAAIELVAAHKLAYHDYSDQRPPYHDANDIYGPIAQWLGSVHKMAWPDYPYDIRPAWLSTQGRFWADELPGVVERIQELRNEVEAAPDLALLAGEG